MDSLASALALWTAVKPRALELAGQGPAVKAARLAPLTAVLAPHFAPLADPALAARDPDRCGLTWPWHARLQQHMITTLITMTCLALIACCILLCGGCGNVCITFEAGECAACIPSNVQQECQTRLASWRLSGWSGHL